MCDIKTTAASLSWFSVVTPLASFILGFIIAVFAEPARQRLFRPVLRLSFAGTEDNIAKTQTVSGTEAIYVRAKVINEKPRLARQCRAYLTKVEIKDGAENFAATNYVDSIQLAWACQIQGNERAPLDLPNGVSQYIDVAATSSITNTFALQIAPFPIRYSHLTEKTPRTYRYTIQVSGDGVEPKFLKLVFVWKGKWDDAEAYEDKGDA